MKPKQDELFTSNGLASHSTAKTIWSVSELTKQIKFQLEQSFTKIWVSGEVSNFVRHSSGHMYMTLKDKGAQICLVIFASVNRYLKFEIKNGMEVVVSGPVTVYARSGQYQIMGQYIEPKGVGALQLAFEQLKEKLKAEGLFDEHIKRDVPAYPQTIGVVTSPTGAAIRDILNVLERRYPVVDVLVCPVKVQGEGAAQEIASAIELCNGYAHIDVLIVGRGGGSMEDLWAFNEEIVARAIYASDIPIVSAVGHEIDFSIADFVADMRAPTPSAAAELVVPDVADLQRRLAYSYKNLVQSMRRVLADRWQELRLLVQNHSFRDYVSCLQQCQQQVDALEEQLHGCHQVNQEERRLRLKALQERLNLLSPWQRLAWNKEELKHLEHALLRTIDYRLKRSRESVSGQIGKINVLSPLNVISRGYSIVFDAESGDVIKSTHSLLEGMLIKTQLHDGDVYSLVDRVCPQA